MTGNAPEGLRNLSAYALRYAGQLSAYFLFVTDAYPNASPLEGESPELVGAVGLAEQAA